MNGIIYQATLADGRRYIGKTTQSLDDRVHGHLRDARAGSETMFHQALASNPDDCTWETLRSGVPEGELADAEYTEWFARRPELNGCPPRRAAVQEPCDGSIPGRLVMYSFKIHQSDLALVRIVADKQRTTVSSWIRKAVVDRLRSDGELE